MSKDWMWCRNCGEYKELFKDCTCYPALREEAARKEAAEAEEEREAKDNEGTNLLIAIAIVAYFIALNM